MSLQPINPFVPSGDCRSYEIDPSDLRTPRTAEIFGRWHDLNRQGRIPGYDSFKPETMWDVLGSIMLARVESTDPPVFRYSLYGTRLARTVGHDMTSKTIQEFPWPALAELTQRDYASAYSERRPSAHRVTVSDGSITRTYDRVILPLASDGQNVDTLLVVSLDLTG